MPRLSSPDSATPVRRPLATLPPEIPGRVLMAASGLLVLHLDPPDYGLLPWAMNPLLVAYLLFALVVLLRELQGRPSPRHLDWIDLAWLLALTSVTGGTSSVLFFMLLLPIISRAFRAGFAAGWEMTLITTVGLLVFGWSAAPRGELFEYNRALIRPFTLLILGYILAREGGAQLRAHRQLALLAGITAVGNPRLGADRTLLNAAQRIRTAYGVKACLILLRRDPGEPALMARADAAGARIEPMPDAASSVLMNLPDRLSVLHRPRGSLVLPAAEAVDVGERASGLSDLLEAPAWLSTPLRRNDDTVGRLFILDADLRSFDAPEVGFIERACAHLMLIVERIRLQEQLASAAAQRERRRLAHDLHDLAIQPYLGVQLGLSAILRRPDCPPGLADELRGLQELSRLGVGELRGILEASRSEMSSATELSTALARLAAHYREQFGIEVSVYRDPALTLGDHLAGDVLAMISESLSNVRRHTASTHASISLRADGDHLLLELSNRNTGTPAPAFVPKSISARIRELGGDGAMTADRDGQTVLSLRIPL